MSETHGINLNINAANAKRGADTYVAAINSISSATLKYKKAMDAVSGKASKVDFSAMAKQLNAVSQIRISGGNTRAINDLSAALRNFRGPSAGAIKTTRDFLRVLQASQVNGSLARQIAAISTSLHGFRSPSRSSASAVQALMTALGGSRLNPQTAGHIAAIAQSLSAFRGPSVASVRNINGMVDALNRLRNPPDLSRLAAALSQIAAAGNTANRSIQNLSSMHQRHSTSMRRSSSEALSLTGNMRGLENAFSASYQAGSMLRSLFGALTLSEFTRGVYDASVQTQKFATTLGVTEKTSAGVRNEMAFATNIADKYGISISGVYSEYAKFSTAAKLAGQSTENVRYIFESVSSAMRVMGTDTEGQARVFRALTQMFSKGAVRAEELVQQMGEQIPGAFQLMQDALSEKMGKKIDLAKMLELGQVDDSAVVLMAKKLMDVFGPQVAAAMQRVDAQIGRLQNSWYKFQEAIGSGGVTKAVADVADKIANIMNSSSFKGQAVGIAKVIGDGIRKIGDAAVYAMTHTKEIAAAISGIIAMGAAGKIIDIVRAVMTMGAAFGTAGAALALIPVAIGAATIALAYFWNDTITVGKQTAEVGAIATKVWTDIKSYAQDAWEYMKTFDLSRLMQEFNNFDLAAATSLVGVSDNATKAASNTSTVWQRALNLIIAYAMTMYAKVGTAFQQLASAGTGYVAYLAKSMVPGADKDALWAEYIKSEKKAFDQMNADADKFTLEFAKRMNVTPLDVQLGVTGIIKPKVEDYIKQAREEAKAREQARLIAENEERKRAALRKPDQFDAPQSPDLSQIDPIKQAAASTKNDSVAQRLKAVSDATVSYKSEVQALLQQLQAGKITLDQYNQGLDFQAKKLQEVTDPYQAMVRTMKDDLGVQGMATRAREVEIALREKTNALMEKGVTLTAAQTDELRKLIQQQQQMNDKPLKEWVDGIDTLGVATDKVAVTSIQGLNDQIAELVVTGKADFASLAQSILKDFIKVGLEQTEKQLFSPFFGGTQTAPPPGTVAQPAANTTAAAFNSVDLRPSLAATAPALDTLKVAADSAAQALGRIGGVNPTTLPGTQSSNVSGQTTVPNDFSTMAAANQWKANNPVPNDFSTMAAANMAKAATTTATPYNASTKTLTLTPQEIIDLKKTLSTEVDGRLTGDAYNQQAAGVTDTILNRKVAGNWGPSVTDVVNAKSQFSDINGGVAWKDNRTSVSQLPDSMLNSGTGLRSSQFVDDYLAKRMNGTPSSVDGNLNYANPNFADPSAQKWINQLDGPTLGQGNMVHKHGTADGLTPVDSNYKIAMANQASDAATTAATPSNYTYPQTPGLNWDGRMQKDVNGLVLHHTGPGMQQPGDVVDVLNKRNLGAQYVMDRNGQVTQLAPDMARVSQTKPAENGSGLTNSNSIGMEVMAKNDADVTEAQKLAGQEWIAKMKDKYPNIGDNVYGHGELNSDKQATEGMGIVNMYRQNHQATDPQTTNSVTATATNTNSIKDASAALNQAMPSFDKLKTTVTNTGTAAQTASQQAQQANTTNQTATQQKIAADTQAGVAVQTAGQQSLDASQNFTTAGQQINSAGQTAQQAAPQVNSMSSGLQQLLGPLSSVVPGLGQFGSSILSLLGSLGTPSPTAGLLPGLFREGGFATAPVELGKMPAYAEGTANTGSYGRGGIPSVLHPNEAVIPLSRGRKIGVELNGQQDHEPTEFQKSRGAGGGSPIFNLNLSGIKSADDFKKSKRQIKNELAGAYQRAQRRA